jgi:hypothetical protein
MIEVVFCSRFDTLIWWQKNENKLNILQLGFPKLIKFFTFCQGGMFVFRGKELLYARKDEGTGDHAPLDDVFDVCCKVPVA